jgi:hypothetical protein
MRVCQLPRIVCGESTGSQRISESRAGAQYPVHAAWADVINGGMTPQAAVEKACKRVEEIFANFPIAQTE